MARSNGGRFQPGFPARGAVIDQSGQSTRMPWVSRWPEPLARAYGACEALARSHYENFPVASWLLPAEMRPHVAAVYAFARIADDMADEGTGDPSERRARLAAWQQRLHENLADDATDRRVPAD